MLREAESRAKGSEQKENGSQENSDPHRDDENGENDHVSK